VNNLAVRSPERPPSGSATAPGIGRIASRRRRRCRANAGQPVAPPTGKSGVPEQDIPPGSRFLSEAQSGRRNLETQDASPPRRATRVRAILHGQIAYAAKSYIM